MKPIVSIVGRPNVGKSTLFNRMLGYHKAITEDIPGVTRDRNYGEFDYAGKSFILVDTGGFELKKNEEIASLVKEHIHAAMEESSMIIFLMDGKDGLLPEDQEIASILRRYKKPVFYAVNKLESPKREAAVSEFYALGVDKIYALSAAHGMGLGDLLDDLASRVEPEPEEKVEQGLRIALVGRPNTGKSSIVNRLLGSERMIVSDQPGTTRDAVDSAFLFQEKRFVIIDTAGIRRKSRISLRVEEYSVASAIRSVERAGVVNLVIDAREGVAHQDAAIAHLVAEKGKGIAIVVNKWDLVEEGTAEAEYLEMVREKLPHVNFAPVVFVSALTGRNITKILQTDLQIAKELERKIATAKLNKTFEAYFQRLSLPHSGRKQLKIFYVNQARTSPPTFILFANFPDSIPEHYKRYIENSLRATFGFKGAPIRLFFRKRS
ncbi:MAG TPA: ribosome biogenesis GTPase Der [Syntrophorhabdales bacterium]|nr:ribosome biogenesis GTPase Der [Syntrophorhabdales bacterium]